MKKKFYILYKTTNLKNEKFYIGVHETFNLEDGYLGSGKRLKNSLYYHGKDNFKREVLEYFDNSKSMYIREQEIVNEELLKNPKCLNIGLGGIGGFVNKKHMINCSNAGNKRQKYLQENDNEWFDKIRKQRSITAIKLHKIGKLKNWSDNVTWKGKIHTVETIEKMKNSHKEIHSGTKNSQFGTCWVTDETINKKITKGTEIPKGFRLGRVIKE